MQLNGTINFAVYENGSEYYGIATITDADRSNKTFTLNGAGIAGDVEIPVLGHRDAFNTTVAFRTATADACRLYETRRHILDCRGAVEEHDPTSGEIRVHAHKVIMECFPKSISGGDIAPASPQPTSVVMSVTSRKYYIDDALMEDYQPLNFHDIDASGNDNLAEVRAALGK